MRLTDLKCAVKQNEMPKRPQRRYFVPHKTRYVCLIRQKNLTYLGYLFCQCGDRPAPWKVTTGKNCNSPVLDAQFNSSQDGRKGLILPTSHDDVVSRTFLSHKNDARLLFSLLAFHFHHCQFWQRKLKWKQEGYIIFENFKTINFFIWGIQSGSDVDRSMTSARRKNTCRERWREQKIRTWRFHWNVEQTEKVWQLLAFEIFVLFAIWMLNWIVYFVSESGFSEKQQQLLSEY